MYKARPKVYGDGTQDILEDSGSPKLTEELIHTMHNAESCRSSLLCEPWIIQY